MIKLKKIRSKIRKRKANRKYKRNVRTLSDIMIIMTICIMLFFAVYNVFCISVSDVNNILAVTCNITFCLL